MLWKKRGNVEEFNNKLWDNVRDIQVSITKLEGRMDNFESLLKNLRGIVNRKLKLDPPTSETNEGEDLNSDDGFNFLR